ncbi:MAG: hypothetical protein RBU21_03845 [FCB group bacterium]|jgi:tetratricopeptide (TPR) repeat protein|nr:hypothetical protein [FCB group bacterium]
MNTGALKDVLKENWHLAVLLAGLLGAGVFLQFREATAPGGAEAASYAEDKEAAATAEPPADATRNRPSPQEQVKATIAEHKAKFEAAPDDKDAPLYLSAMGNLYRYKLNDYDQAIQAYQLLLHDYPEWEGNRNTLIALVACYEHQGNREGVRDTYERMLKFFAPESQEYQYAKAQLAR